MRNVPDRLFRWVTLAFALAILGITTLIAWQLFVHSRLSQGRFGFGFLWSTTWDPVAERFGALPFLYGTLVTSTIALVVAVPLGLGTAVFLSEMVPPRVSSWLAFLVELLAAIPSVIYGLVGVFVIVPWMRTGVEPYLSRTLGFLPLFQGTPYGVGFLTAGLVLAVMVVPFITSVSREVLLAVPRVQREAALALGATRWEVLRMAVLPYARAGIVASILLALARALGETMAVTMVIGNRPQIVASLFEPGYTMAAVLANEFTEATSSLYLHALIEIGLVLFCVTVVVNGLARIILARLSIRPGRA
ncbi:MAG: phosphate ABC transporter permease subunit PstC [Candidatus Omnitrophica bacterium]|nr:phosphate ABC transporter permease subunit PstC [Candidatus Omnitrophota bacterium]